MQYGPGSKQRMRGAHLPKLGRWKSTAVMASQAQLLRRVAGQCCMLLCLYPMSENQCTCTYADALTSPLLPTHQCLMLYTPAAVLTSHAAAVGKLSASTVWPCKVASMHQAATTV